MSQEKKLLGILKGIAPYSNRGLNHEALAHLLDTDIGSIRSLISSLRNKKQEIGIIDDQYESIKSNRLKNYVFYTEDYSDIKRWRLNNIPRAEGIKQGAPTFKGFAKFSLLKKHTGKDKLSHKITDSNYFSKKFA